MKPKINIGCGMDSWGDVRVDVRRNSVATLLLDFDKVPLPFPDKYFSQARLWHVLEHSKNPQRLLIEAIRVADTVHAKFPCKHDRIPFILANLTTLKAKLWYDSIRDCFLHILTQIRLVDSPWSHRWLVQPFGDYHLNKRELFSLLRSGRKKRLFKHIPKLSMNTEWECWVKSEKE